MWFLIAFAYFYRQDPFECSDVSMIESGIVDILRCFIISRWYRKSAPEFDVGSKSWTILKCFEITSISLYLVTRAVLIQQLFLVRGLDVNFLRLFWCQYMVLAKYFITLLEYANFNNMEWSLRSILYYPKRPEIRRYSIYQQSTRDPRWQNNTSDSPPLYIPSNPDP